MTRVEYDALPIEERLNYAERAVSLLSGELRRKAEECKIAAKRLRSDIKKSSAAGRWLEALTTEVNAEAAERTARQCDTILFRLHTWQDRSTTPAEDLPFRP